MLQDQYHHLPILGISTKLETSIPAPGSPDAPMYPFLKNVAPDGTPIGLNGY